MRICSASAERSRGASGTSAPMNPSSPASFEYPAASQKTDGVVMHQGGFLQRGCIAARDVQHQSKFLAPGGYPLTVGLRAGLQHAVSVTSDRSRCGSGQGYLPSRHSSALAAPLLNFFWFSDSNDRRTIRESSKGG